MRITAAKPAWCFPTWARCRSWADSRPHTAHGRHRRLLLGMVFGLVICSQMKNLPVHKSMLDVSEIIFETCKTYLITQGKFLLMLVAVHRRRSSSSTSACSQHCRRDQGRR